MKVKMKPWDRVLLALYALLGILLTLGIALAMCGGLELSFMGFAMRLGDGVWPMVALALLSAVLLVWSIRVLMVAFRREPKLDKSSVSVQNTENGAVRIALQAMDTLVKQAIGEADGVLEIKTSIVNHEDSISVNIDMTLQSDVHIPNVTMLMQRSIKNFIEEFSGIAVRDVTVMVSRIVEVTPMPPLALSQAGEKVAIEALGTAQADMAQAPVEEQAVSDALAEELELEPASVVDSDAAWENIEGDAEAAEDGETAEDTQARKDGAEGFSEKDIW